MTTKAMLAALAMCCTTAMACPESEKSTVQTVSNETKTECVLACDEAKVQTVADTKSDCTKTCDGTGAAVQTVANETKSDCAKACDGASVQTVADTKSDCSKSCDATGAAVQTVANESKGDCCGDCTTAPNCETKCEGTSVQTVAYGEGDCSKSCPLEAAFPVMLMKVGDETTQCSDNAAKMCDKTGKSMTYLVSGKEYNCSVEAKEAQYAAMKDMLASMTHVSFNVDGKHTECPVGAKIACESTGKAMKYQVGTLVFDDAGAAIQAAAMARAAIHQVKMTYEVAGEKMECSTKACDMAATCETKSVTYVVNDKKTGCEKTAEFNLVEAQLMAAIDGVRKSLS